MRVSKFTNNFTMLNEISILSLKFSSGVSTINLLFSFSNIK